MRTDFSIINLMRRMSRIYYLIWKKKKKKLKSNKRKIRNEINGVRSFRRASIHKIAII